MKFTRRQFVKGGVSAFTFGFAAPQFLTDLAFAQAPPARNLVVLYLGGGNDALSTLVPYRDAGLLQPAADAGGAGGHRAADRHRFGRQSSSGCIRGSTGLQEHLRSGPAGHHPAHGLSELEPLALPGLRHLGHGESREHAGHRVARPLSRYAAVAGRSARRLEHDARNAARADGAHRRRAGDHQSGAPTASRARTAATKRCSSAPRRRRSRRTCRSIGRISRS